jgi:hypothetical protein
MMYPFESLRTRNGCAAHFLLPRYGRMKRALGVFLLTTFAAAAPAHAAGSCRIPAAHVVAGNRTAQLLSIPTPNGSALYACIRRSGRKIALDDSYSDARLSGRWVAWQRAGKPGNWRIAVHDLRTGKERLVDGHEAAHSLRLTTRGTIAWAQQQDAGGTTPLYENSVDAGGRLLDAGDVDASSVRLAGRRLSWLSGGVAHSAIV